MSFGGEMEGKKREGKENRVLIFWRFFFLFFVSFFFSGSAPRDFFFLVLYFFRFDFS